MYGFEVPAGRTKRRRISEGPRGPREATDLSRWIEKQGLPVAVLAARIGVTPKTVYYWASGYRVPDLVAAARLEHITDGEVGWMSFLKTKLARQIWQDMVDHSQEVAP